MDTVAADRELAALRFHIVEVNDDARAVLIDLEAAMREPHGVAAQARSHRIEHHLVQVGAMDRKLRPVVAGEAAARLLVDELAVAAVEGELARLDGVRGQRLLQAELAQLAHGMRQQVDADAQRQHVGRGLEHARRDAGLVQAERQRQPADAAAHDQNVGVTHSGWIPRLATTSAQRARSRTTISPSAVGVELAGLRPCASNTLLASGEFRIAATSWLSRATISGGVPLGAKKPYHMSTSTPFNPLSPRVGTSGKLRQALGTAGGDRLQLAGADVLGGDMDGQEHVADLAAQKILHRARRALVGHVHQLDARRGLDQRHRQMMRRADARAAVGERLGRGLGRRDQLAERVGLLAGMGHQHQRAPGREAERREVGHRIVGQVLVEAGVHDQRVDRRHQRLAVGLGARHLLAADIAAGARDILHHHGLAEPGRQPLGHEAGDDVGAGAGRERHHELDRLIGPGEGGLEGQTARPRSRR